MQDEKILKLAHPDGEGQHSHEEDVVSVRYNIMVTRCGGAVKGYDILGKNDAGIFTLRGGERCGS